MKRFALTLLFLVLSFGVSYGLSFDVTKVGAGTEPAEIIVDEPFTLEFYANFATGDDSRITWSTPFRLYGTGDVTSLSSAGTFVNNTAFDAFWSMLCFHPNNNASTLESWDGDLTNNAGGLSGDQFNYSGTNLSPPLPASGSMKIFEVEIGSIVGPVTSGTFCVDSGDFVNNTYDWLLDAPSPSFGPVCWDVIDTSYTPPTTLTLPDMESPDCAEACIPITVGNFSGVAGVELHIDYDEGCLTYDSVSLGNLSGATVNGGSGEIHIIWEDFMNPMTLTDGETLTQLCFSGLSTSACAIGFQTSCELVDESGEPISLETYDGSLYCVCDTPMTPYLYGPSTVEANTMFTVCWEAAGPGTFELQDSTDTSEWTTIYTDTGVCDTLYKEAGTYYYRVRACNDCGNCSEWSEIITVVVEPPCDPPVITCPGSTFDFTICEDTILCVDVPITDYDSVWTDASYWSGGALCFSASATGTYTYTVIAVNECGEDTCFVSANITAVDPVEITCPGAPLSESICGAGDVCISLPIAYADDVTVTGPATWNADELCFMADTTGTYTFSVEASNICGPETCDITVDVEVIDIPAVPAGCFADDTVYVNTNYDVCWSMVDGATYYEIEESDGTPVVIDNGTEICRTFNNATAGTYTYRARACNDCGCSDFTTEIQVEVIELPVECAKLYIPDMSSEICAEACIPITVNDFEGVAGVELHINYDTTCLTYSTIAEGYLSGATFSGGDGMIHIIWEDFMNPLTLDDGTTLVELCFTNLPQEVPCAIGFEDNCELVDESGEPICNETYDGSLMCTECPLPEISCPADPIDTILCATGMVCIDLPITGANSVSTSMGAWADDQLCVDVTASGRYDITVVATNDCGDDSCVVTIDADIIEAVSITCPGSFDFEMCGAGTICVILEILNEEMVDVTPYGVWAGDTLCVAVDTSGEYVFHVEASNYCGFDECDVTINFVNMTPPAVPAGCFADDTVYVNTNYDVCWSMVDGATYYEIEESDGTPVVIDNGTEICRTFNNATAGTYTYRARACNDCGCSDFTTEIQVEVIELPVECAKLYIPDMSSEICAEACIPITVNDFEGVAGVELHINYDTTCLTYSTIAEGYLSGATFSGGDGMIHIIWEDFMNPLTLDDGTTLVELCFTNLPQEVPCAIGFEDNCELVDESGEPICNETYDGSLMCTECPLPEISCPADPIDTILCATGMVCIDLPITGANSVSTSMGAWADDQLCVDVTASGRYDITVVATNDCGDDSCVVTIDADIIEAVSITCPTGPFNIEICAAYSICIPLPIMNAEEVNITPQGDWMNDTLCVPVDTSGMYVFHIEASNYCGYDECDVTINLVQKTAPAVPSGPYAADTVEANTPYDVCWNAVEDVDYYVIMQEDSLSIVSLDTLMDTCNSFSNSGDFYLYSVMACNECGCSDWSQQITVVIEEPIICDTVNIDCPDFTYYFELCDPDTIRIPLTILYADLVSVEGAFWENDELVIYAEDGEHTFNVYASNNCSADSCVVVVDITIPDPPTACFEVSPQSGTAPLEVNFTNCSEYSKCSLEGTFYWDFGDGATSTDTEPTHTYEEVGCYDVSLTVTDSCGHSDIATMENAVCVTEIYPPEWINVYCGAPTLNGDALMPGDMIYAYDPDGVMCGSAEVEPDGSYGFMPIYRDDATTPEDDGAEPGDKISFMINDVDVTTNPVIYWTENGDYFELCEFISERCLTFELEKGWNWISWNVQYTDDILDFVYDFESCIDVVLSFDQGGKTFVPGLYEFATLTDVDYHHGYLFKMSCPATFELCGLDINDDEGIYVFTGWNLISYWPNEEMTVEDALVSIIDYALVVLGFENEGLTWAPDFIDFNTLTHMKPQFGYWLKSSDDAMLAYPGFDPIIPPAKSNVASYKVAPSRSWMSVYGAGITFDGQPIASDATIDVRTEDGTLCGIASLDNGVMKFTPVYGYDDADEITSSYPQTGAALEVYVDGIRAYPDLTWNGNDQVRLEALFSSKDGHTDTDIRPTDYTLYQNYPNPFNPQTTIKFYLPSGGQVELSVYNMLGQKIRTLVNESYASGEHEVVWDGASDDGYQVASGVYFYRLKSAGFVDTRKMNLMK